MTNKELKILFFGDLVGKVGRNSVIAYLADLKNKNQLPDFVIVNGENVAGGMGITKRDFQQIKRLYSFIFNRYSI